MRGSLDATLPVKMNVFIDIQDSTIGDDAAAKQLGDFLQKYYDSGSDDLFKDYEVDIDLSDPGYVVVKFDGDQVFTGSYDSSDNYFSDAEVEVDDYPVTEDDFLTSVRVAVKKAPTLDFEFERGSTNSKDDQFLKNAIDFDDNCEFPDDDEIYFALVDDLENIKAAAAEDAYDRWRDRGYDESKQINESTTSVCLPYQVRLLVGLSEDYSDEQVTKVADYVRDYLKKNGNRDWPRTDFDVEELGEHAFAVDFNGDAEYLFTPGSMATWDYPGDPDDLEVPFEDESDFEYYLIDILKKAPFEIDFDTAIETDFSKLPTESEINDAINDKLYGDELDTYHHPTEESVLKSVLAGKSLTEALNENEFWEVQPEEVYADKDEEARQAFNKELNQWKTKTLERAKAFAAAAMDLRASLKKGERDFDVKTDIDLDNMVRTAGDWTMKVSKVVK